MHNITPVSIFMAFLPISSLFFPNLCRCYVSEHWHHMLTLCGLPTSSVCLYTFTFQYRFPFPFLLWPFSLFPSVFSSPSFSILSLLQCYYINYMFVHMHGIHAFNTNDVWLYHLSTLWDIMSKWSYLCG